MFQRVLCEFGETVVRDREDGHVGVSTGRARQRSNRARATRLRDGGRYHKQR
jgi:hypothetical protein